MEKLILIDEQLLKYLIMQESQKIVGKCMKRFEIHDDKNEIKKEIKELLYECYRDLGDLIINCSKSKEAIYLKNADENKEKKYGK